MAIHERTLWAVVSILSISFVGWLTWPDSANLLQYGGLSIVVIGLIAAAGTKFWRMIKERLIWGSLGLLMLFVATILYLGFLVWLVRPDWLPRRAWYDFIEYRHVTMGLVDPDLIKVEQWEILGDSRQVLFVHPANTGTTTLVYPVMVRSGTYLTTALALAPEAWSGDGDGVVFSIFVEDDAGMRLLFSQYVDPKHQQQDRNWLPVDLNLSSYEGKLVRIILSVSSGPAGNLSYDWSGWAEPRLVQSLWP